MHRTVLNDYPHSAIATMDEFQLPNAWNMRRMTVALCCFADGTKAAPFVVYTSRRQPMAVFDADLGVVTAANPEGWMTQDMMLQWLGELWAHRPGVTWDNPAPGVLIMDRLLSHTRPAVRMPLLPPQRYSVIMNVSHTHYLNMLCFLSVLCRC
eukprot:GHVU01134491.1.p1 GENE.GHVU01134491.1~~GHVU01134491.1.p1  ORF type:complete len:153 (+),score=2.88 GHVU01134491.1:129-587(+)